MTQPATDMQSALEMDHLKVPSTEELKQQVTVQVQPDEAAPKEAEPDARDKEEWTFTFDWTDARDKKWFGTFTNKILSIGEQQAVAAAKARFTGGMPWESIDPEMQVINQAVAHMMFSLAPSDNASWGKDLRALKDPSLIIALWTKVSSHETRFFRLGPPEEESQG